MPAIREKHILELTSGRMSSVGIYRRLNISLAVITHNKNIWEKLGAGNSSEMIAIAFRKEILK